MYTQSNDGIPDIASCDTCNLNRSGGLQGRHFHFTGKPRLRPKKAAAWKAAAAWLEIANMAALYAATGNAQTR